MTEYDMESEESEYSDSDAELQDALASGKLKPGLNQIIEKTTREYVNNVGEMKRKINEIKLKLPWIETLDCINKQAPLAPELAAQMHEQEARRANQLKNNAKLPQFSPTEDPVLNDFKREMMFHRQAQSAVLEAIPRLKQMGIATKRPDDYFAEMAKTDDHMQKVRQALMKRQVETQQKERVRQLRIQRKEGKAIQTQVRVERQKEKKEILDQVKKARKGMSDNLDFLEDGKKGSGKQPMRSKRAMEKLKMKNKKFGFGGRKKGSKMNTKDSAADISEYRRPGKGNNKKGGKAASIRPGKNRRQKMKSKGRK